MERCVGHANEISGNAPPTGWPVAYTRLGPFAIELALAAANRNNCHIWHLKWLLHFALLLQLPPAAALGASFVQTRPAIEGGGKGRDLARHHNYYYLHLIKNSFTPLRGKLL